MKNKTFGPVLWAVLVIAIILILITQTSILSHTKIYASGEGDKLIQNAVSVLENGSNCLVMNRVSDREFDIIIDRIYDEPNLFWIDEKYNAFSIGQISVLVVYDRYGNIDHKTAELSGAAALIINQTINDNMSEYEKVLAIHDWICANVEYDQTESGSDQDAYGALIMKKARCAGYAKAFSFLLDKVGIQSQVISGKSLTAGGEGVEHAWNAVLIDNEWCYFDITWNDTDSERICQYDWFGINAEEFKKSHFPNIGYQWIPSKSNNNDYYVKNEMYLNHYSVKNIASQIRTHGKTFSIKCKDSAVMRELIAALSNNQEMKKIMRELGWSGVYKISYVKNELANCVHIKIHTKDQTTNPI